MTIPLAIPNIGEREREYVERALDSGFVSSAGQLVAEFETAFAAAVGAGFAVACSSGTAALHLALVALDIPAGATVAVSDFTFIASANAIRYVNARPWLIDSESNTWNMDTQRLRDEIVKRASAGMELPAAIEIVHALGTPADMAPLLEIQERYGLPLIEDAAEALGATWVSGGPCEGRQVGTVGRLGCFSFNGNKIITTGGGGMVVTDDVVLAKRIKHLSTQAKIAPDHYAHDEVGFNYRLTSLAAALGLAQLERLPDFLDAKRRIAAKYETDLADLPLIRLPEQSGSNPSRWLYSVMLDDAAKADIGDSLAMSRALRDRGVDSRPLWQPMHMQDPYRTCELLGNGTMSASLYQRGFSLPCSTSLTDAEREIVVSTLTEILGH
jgi:dTDP-4-amino-4,6-dideoxygalactose transaminase